MKLKLRTELVSGTTRIYPECDASRSMCSAFARKCLNLRELRDLTEVFDVEYSGRRLPELEELGAKFI